MRLMNKFTPLRANHIARITSDFKMDLIEKKHINGCAKGEVKHNNNFDSSFNAFKGVQRHHGFAYLWSLMSKAFKDAMALYNFDPSSCHVMSCHVSSCDSSLNATITCVLIFFFSVLMTEWKLAFLRMIFFIIKKKKKNVFT